ncbi:MAG: Beta-lactamase hydrolase-like protein [Pseudidiomarina mangrovi]|nr:MAG: Beta-lactamase hydrolase-like protein [Pseudidiomarina mangrovi]
MKQLTFTLLLLSLTLVPISAYAQVSDSTITDLSTLENFKRGSAHLSAAQPSAEHLQLLARQGVTAVINFRDDALPEEASWATSAGMAYYHIPVSGGDQLSREKVAQLDQVLRALDGQQALLHCSSGNRAAAMLTLHAAWYQGADAEQALAIGQQHGLDSEALIERLQELLKP